MQEIISIEDCFKKTAGILINAKLEEKKDLDINTLINTKSAQTKENCANCHYLCKNKEAICSFKTYTKMRTGQTIMKKCQYEDFASKLNLKYQMNRKLIQDIMETAQKLEKCIKSGSEKDYLDCLHLVEMHLKETEKTLLFEELYQMFYYLIQLELYKITPSRKLIMTLEKIVDTLAEPIKYQTYYLIYRYYSSTHKDIEKANQLKKEISDLYPDSIYFKLKAKADTMSLLKYYVYVSDLETDHLSPHEKYFVYDRCAYAAFNLKDYETAMIYIGLCLTIAENEETKLPDKKIHLVYLKYAMSLHYLKEYEKASIYFKKVYLYNPNLLVLNFISFIHSFEAQNKINEIKHLLGIYKENQLTDSLVKTIYGYYKLKYLESASPYVLQKHIIDYLCPILYAPSCFYNIIERDLITYCEITRSYKLISDFDKAIRKI